MANNLSGPQMLSGEKLVHAMFRLPQLIKIHLPNNQLLLESLADFRTALEEICSEDGAATLSIYHGRLQLNDERMAYDSGNSKLMARMVDYMQDRGLLGFHFTEVANLSNEEIISFIELLNVSKNDEDPSSWLKMKLEEASFQWVSALIEQGSHEGPPPL
ncbi:MAG: hypothetical protein ACRCTY_00360, partial [Candidatus Adiutrix sp.]